MKVTGFAALKKAIEEVQMEIGRRIYGPSRKLLDNLGLDSEFRGDRITWTGCVLY